MHSKEWFSICAMVFVVLKDSIFVFEDYSKHFYLVLSHASIKQFDLDSYSEYTYNFIVLWNAIFSFWETPSCVVWLKKGKLCI